MKKMIIFLTTLLFLSIPAVETEDIAEVSITGPMEATVTEHSRYYVEDCRYFVSEMPSLGTEEYSVILPSGHVYIFQTDEVSGNPVYDGMLAKDWEALERVKEIIARDFPTRSIF